MRRAGIDYAWSREDNQLCLNLSQFGFTFDRAERLTGMLGDDSDGDDRPASPLAKVICELQRLRSLAAVDRWPAYDRALRALESL